MYRQKRKVILILLVLGSAAFLMRLAFCMDAPVRSFILESQGTNGVKWNHSLEQYYCHCVSRYGDWPELMLLGAFGVWISRRCHSIRWQRILITAMIASTLAGALTNTLRLTTGRTRPRVSPAIEQGWYGPYHEGKWIVGRSEFNSFPSGHTATAFGFAIVVFLTSPFWGIPALFIATLIASSRLMLGAHHPSDLVAAIIISSAVGWYCWNSKIITLFLLKNQFMKFPINHKVSTRRSG